VRRTTQGLLAVVAGAALVGIGVAIGSSSGRPAPVPAVTTTAVREVPGPDVTVLEPAPPDGGVIGTYRGAGSQVTPEFNVPDSGDYIVAWSFSGNADSSGPSNFIVTEAGPGTDTGLPNVIGVKGSGSTEVLGAGPTDRLSVQAAGSWTIVIKSAS